MGSKIARVFVNRRIQTKSQDGMDRGVSDSGGEALAVSAGALSPLFRGADFLEGSGVCGVSHYSDHGLYTLSAWKLSFSFTSDESAD